MTTLDHGLSLKGRVRALVFGVALGDALGAPVEKLSAGEIRTRNGRVSKLDTVWHRMAQPAAARNGRIRGNGIVTDDTLMTMCLMDVYGTTRGHLDAWDMADGMVREIAWTPRWVPELQRETLLIERLFYPEKWIYQRLQLSAAEPRQGGLAKDGTREAISASTDVAREQKRAGADHAALTDAFHAAIARFSPMGDDVNHTIDKAGVVTGAYQPSRLGSIEELPLALGFALFNGGEFRRTVEDGINSGRDTDSIGVMAGAILGALHGEAVIDAADLRTLDTANRFAQTGTEILAIDARAAAERQAQRTALLAADVAHTRAAE